MSLDNLLYRRRLKLQRELEDTEQGDLRQDLELELHEVEEALGYEKPTENPGPQRVAVGEKRQPR